MANKKGLSNVVTTVLIILLALSAVIILWTFVSHLGDVDPPQIEDLEGKEYKYEYMCDGRELEDKCNYASIKEGLVLIKECESGHEYVCQTIVQMPIG